ncbi:MAG: AAA family ATPase [Candidatus Thorarchaeota archaeon]
MTKLWVQRLEAPLWSVKYSPRTWNDFIGQNSAITQLRNLAESGSCPNMILYGPNGTGKTSAAQVFSRALLGDTLSANYKMLNLRDVYDYTIAKAKRDIKDLAKLDRSKRSELDEYMSVVFKEVKAEFKAKGQTRDPNKSQLLQGAIRLFASTITVADAMIKILVLDEADVLTRSMQQALRRTMEIYNEACRFIFTTPTLAGWSPAVISRSLVINFPSPSNDVIASLVGRIAESERVEVDSGGLNAIARESSGDMRRAINLLQVASAKGKPVTEDEVYSCSETILTKGVRNMVSAAIDGSFVIARESLRGLLALEGYSPSDILLQIERDLLSRPFEPTVLMSLLDRVAEIDYRSIQARNPFIQITALLASIGRIASVSA